MRSVSRLFSVVTLSAASAVACAGASLSPAPANLVNGYRQMYDLKFDIAHQTFKSWQATHPDDPFGYASDAAAYLFSEFNRLHVLESDLFTEDEKFAARNKLSPDPAIKVSFDQSLEHAEQLARTQLAGNPNDSHAMFALVLANGLRGDYSALIEKRNVASLRYMKTARGIAEKLIAIDPNCYDAYLAIGVENYLLGANPAPVRWFLRLGGAETDKEGGIARLRMTAQKGEYLAPFARLLLAVAALRDKDRDTARTLLQGLAAEFPDNLLYAKELAKIPHS